MIYALACMTALALNPFASQASPTRHTQQALTVLFCKPYRLPGALSDSLNCSPTCRVTVTKLLWSPQAGKKLKKGHIEGMVIIQKQNTITSSQVARARHGLAERSTALTYPTEMWQLPGEVPTEKKKKTLCNGLSWSR